MSRERAGSIDKVSESAAKEFAWDPLDINDCIALWRYAHHKGEREPELKEISDKVGDLAFSLVKAGEESGDIGKRQVWAEKGNIYTDYNYTIREWYKELGRDGAYGTFLREGKRELESRS